MTKQIKNNLIGSIISIVLNLSIFTINYLKDIESLSALYVISLCFVFYYILFWLYQLSKYSVYHLMFGNYQKQKLFNKIIYITISILLFLITALVVLIEKPKYLTLNDKLKEKNSIKNIYIYNRFSNQYEEYNQHDFSKDKQMSIFGIEFHFSGNMKKYIIYKTDYRYQLLLAYLEVFNTKNNEVLLNYLSLSLQALNYYKKEINDINNNYQKLVKKYNDTIDDSDDKYKSMLNIQKYLLETKVNSIKYNDIVKQMVITEKFSDKKEIKIWHSYFQNESDKELVKVNETLSNCNIHFQKEILSKYNKNEPNN